MDNILRSKRVSPARRRHPAEKPIPLLETLIRTLAPPGGRVLDPCAGFHSTALAAAAAGRSATSIELDRGFAAAAHPAGGG